jgi:hypothetical protein
MYHISFRKASLLRMSNLSPWMYQVAQKERLFLKWVVVWRVKVGDLPTPPENSAEGAVQ